LARDAGGNVGTYIIRQGTVVAAAGYTIVSFETGLFTITKAAVTVTPTAGQNKVYGTSDPVFTYASSGLQGADVLTGSLSRQGGENVGNYNITRGDLTAGDNYNVTFVTGVTFEIQKADQVITFGPLADVTEGDPAFTLDASVSTGLPLSYSSSNTAAATVNGVGLVTIVAQGTTTITVTQAGNANYNAVSATQTLVVLRKSGLSAIAAGQVGIYPSIAPRNTNVSLSVNDGALLKNAEVALYNVAGKLVNVTPVKDRITTLTTPDVAGTYIYVFKTRDGAVQSMKVVVK
jgi:hypothetical protein